METFVAIHTSSSMIIPLDVLPWDLIVSSRFENTWFIPTITTFGAMDTFEPIVTCANMLVFRFTVVLFPIDIEHSMDLINTFSWIKTLFPIFTFPRISELSIIWQAFPIDSVLNP